MSHETLIAQLAADARPVTPLPDPRVRSARWLVLAVLAVALGVMVKGLRANWTHAVEDPWFLVTFGLILATGVAAALVAMALSVPGVVSSRWLQWTPVGLLLVWGGVLLAEMVTSGASLTSERVVTGCMWKTYGLAVGPAALLVWLARRAAPLDWRWAGSLAALAALSFGVLGTELICPITRHAHLFTWHFVPVLLMSVVAFAAVSLWTRR
jgi:hypothetical protein